MRLPVLLSVLALAGAAPGLALAQTPPPSTDHYAALKSQNLAPLWLATQRAHPDKQMGKPFVFPDPIGFIEPTYQRFYLHYTASGKTRPTRTRTG